MEDIAKFIEGFRQFQESYFKGDRQLLAPLKTEQKPNTLIIGCSDSRVDPSLMFGCDPGELFVVRNVANLVPPFEESGGFHGVSAALEFAVLTLKVKHIIVMGHSRCGGIGALVNGLCPACDAGFINNWMKIADKALERVSRDMPDSGPDVLARECEKEAILVSLDNLMSFPWIRAQAEAGLVMLHGWYFDIDSGTLSQYSKESGRFEEIA